MYKKKKIIHYNLLFSQIILIDYLDRITDIQVFLLGI